MASLIRVLKTIRNNWKKSIFATVLLGYGVSSAKDYYETQILMRLYCEEAQKYGDQPLPVGQKPRHITVILNPAAKNGKGKKLFEKYSAPLLHLAGVKVSLVKTEYEGQAKSLMEVMDNTDAVMIAGGDGTLLEESLGQVDLSPPMGKFWDSRFGSFWSLIGRSLFTNEDSRSNKQEEENNFAPKDDLPSQKATTH